jgi:V/A-type H+-transporting ATPase subunit I
MQNIFEVFEYFLSYFSNTVSFLRVGAFILVHAGMMLVIFSLAGEHENMVIIVLGNILVIALEGLLSGIQALRLEFYEMFSRCYDGSGRPFISAEQAISNKAK